jgi:hypothetical protein
MCLDYRLGSQAAVFLTYATPVDIIQLGAGLEALAEAESSIRSLRLCYVAGFNQAARSGDPLVSPQALHSGVKSSLDVLTAVYLLHAGPPGNITARADCNGHLRSLLCHIAESDQDVD